MNRKGSFYVKLIFLTIFFLIFYIAIQTIFTSSHEQAHKQIYEYYGIDSKIVLSLFGQSYTENIDNESCTDDCTMMHSMTEAFGYQLNSALNAMVLMVFVVCCLYILYWETKEKRETR